MSYIEKEKLIKADIASIENRVRHAFNQGYDLGFKDGKSKQANCSEIPTGSTTKNDLGVDREDAVERLNAIKQLIGYDKDSEIVKATQKSLDMAIKALEQEPILDKIRAEIDKIYEREGNSADCLNALNELKWFIDKHKADTEDT